MELTVGWLCGGIFFRFTHAICHGISFVVEFGGGEVDGVVRSFSVYGTEKPNGLVWKRMMRVCSVGWF